MIFVVSSGVAEERVDFNRDIRPILSDKCFQCHGPDEETLEAELRLDLRESAVKNRAIVPGKPEASELMKRILAAHADDLMPPPKIKKPITEKESDLLRRWIAEGAEYQGHWAFEPVFKATPPKVEEVSRVKNPIDHFVLAKLQGNGLSFSEEADPHTLARRFALDLTGLLPAPEDVDKFVTAYSRQPDLAVSDYVDKLLASPHHGERWGRHWLDQARYADSNGYTIDGERDMWPYRDWVIRAINEDKPFDEFTIEQLAGDRLPNPDKAQIVASGFHRNTLINQEGGTDDEQFRNEEVVDRVNTTGAVWLGLTLGCAQCHTHKFDPVTQQEYFELFAFFNQGKDVNNTGATVEVSEGELFLTDPDPVKLSRIEAARAKLASMESSRSARQIEWEKNTLEASSEPEKAADWQRIKPDQFYAEGGALLTLLEDNSILAAKGAPNETYRVSLPPAAEPVAAFRLKLMPHSSLPAEGPGLASNGNIVLTRVEFLQNGDLIPVARADHSHAQPGFSAANTIDGRSDTGWAINVGKGSTNGVRMNSEHEAHFVFAKAIAPGGPIEVVLRHEKNPNYNIGRFAIEVSSVAPRNPMDEKLITAIGVPVEERTPEDKKFIAGEFGKVDVELRDAKAEYKAALSSLGLDLPVKAMVMQDLSAPRETYLHKRGDFLARDEDLGPLSPGVPSVLPDLGPKREGMESHDRLDLAHWLVSRDHPLTSRVTVNRVWMRYFGKGIVETENDFGMQSSFPTHPELLDWLASEFVDNGWSMKMLHKLIVTSATYRQSSYARVDLSEKDPSNHLLARQRRIRVEAGIIRDAALSASGLFSAEIGGPGVMPPQPEGVYAFTQRKVNWVSAKGPDRFRRAMYIKFFRSAPYPLLTTFDSPDFQSVCTSRVRSNTPLQSLTLANDEAMFELAQGLGARLMLEIEGMDRVANSERVRRAYALCFSRSPTKKEMDRVLAFQEQQRTSFSADPESARAVAPQVTPEDFDFATAASWTAVARALMNTDEFITRE